MSAYVDELKTYPNVKVSRYADRYSGGGKRWCHLTADTSEELHAFAARLGLKRAYCQHEDRPTEHYDLTPAKRAQAVRLGAQDVTGRVAFRRAIEGATAR